MGAGKKAQWIEELVAKPEDLSSIPEIHMVEGGNCLPRVVPNQIVLRARSDIHIDESVIPQYTLMYSFGRVPSKKEEICVFLLFPDSEKLLLFAMAGSDCKE